MKNPSLKPKPQEPAVKSRIDIPLPQQKEKDQQVWKIKASDLVDPPQQKTSESQQNLGQVNQGGASPSEEPTVHSDESPIPEPSKQPEEPPSQAPSPSVEENPTLPSSPQPLVQHELSASPPLAPPQPTVDGPSPPHVPQQPLVEGSSSSMPAALSADSRQQRASTPNPNESSTNQDSTNPTRKDGHMDFAADVEGINLIVELSALKEAHAASPSAIKKKKEISPSNVVTRQQSRRSSSSTSSL